MKISAGSLSANPQRDAEISKETQKFTKEQVTWDRSEPTDAYCDEVVDFAGRHSIIPAKTLKEAFRLRQEGTFSMSWREVDTVARNMLGAEHTSESFAFIKEVLMLKGAGNFICDGTVGAENTPWSLRESYNKGLDWFKKRDKIYTVNAEGTPQEKRMTEILSLLRDIDVPAWQREIDLGFAYDLCKPEWLSWGEFRKETASRQTYYVTDDRQLIHAEK